MTDTPEPLLVHVLGREEWAAHIDPLRPASLGVEGFVHLSRADQIAGVCARFYADRDDLVLLVVDPARLPAPVVWEDTHGHGEAFPHLYAPLPDAAVLEVRDHPRRPDGTFPTPELPRLDG